MWSNLLSGFIGAVIAVGLQEYSKRRERKRNINVLLLAIKTEITVLQERFNKNYEKIKKENGLPIMFYFYIEQNYFLVLEGQSTLLGAILDEDLREIIIKTYIHIKSLIDSFKTNNITLDKYENNHLLFLQNSSNPLFSELEKSYQMILTYYANSIRGLIQEIENNIKTLIPLIDKYLDKHSFICFKCGGRKFT